MESLPCLGRVESPGPLFPGVGDFAVFANHIKPVWPALVGFFGFVIHAVHEDGDFESEFCGAMFGGFFPFLNGFVVGDQNAVADVLLGLLAVGRMGFADVDDQEFGFGFFFAEPPVQILGMLPERGSRIRTEDEHNRAFAFEIGEADVFFAPHPFERETGSKLADLRGLRPLGGDQSGQGRKCHGWVDAFPG